MDAGDGRPGQGGALEAEEEAVVRDLAAILAVRRLFPASAKNLGKKNTF
jgi:hypothetical protein